jgi:hypothetical protein
VIAYQSAPGAASVDLADDDPCDPGPLKSWESDWLGTHTYDIWVEKYDGGTALVDDYMLKGPYSLWVPETGGDGKPGHEAKWVTGPDGKVVLRAHYWLHDQRGRDARVQELVPIAPDLAERAAATVPVTTDTRHDGRDEDADGANDWIPVYALSDDDPGGRWRLLWTGADSTGPSSAVRRTHDTRRMMVANVDDADLIYSKCYVGPGVKLQGEAYRAVRDALNACGMPERTMRPPVDLQAEASSNAPLHHPGTQMLKALLLCDIVFFWGHGVSAGTSGADLLLSWENPQGPNAEVFAEVEELTQDEAEKRRRRNRQRSGLASNAAVAGAYALCPAPRYVQLGWADPLTPGPRSKLLFAAGCRTNAGPTSVLKEYRSGRTDPCDAIGFTRRIQTDIALLYTSAFWSAFKEKGGRFWQRTWADPASRSLALQAVASKALDVFWDNQFVSTLSLATWRPRFRGSDGLMMARDMDDAWQWMLGDWPDSLNTTTYQAPTPGQVGDLEYGHPINPIFVQFNTTRMR